ncbi:MAG TPA: type I glyceraldehyde-3-phosphate dehydrogenase [Planctomycetota bacterium]|nr:type I glyceraldehyde-3-phosphate dehydrogenase [Planctomycetota bacterium]OQC21318.1 MAG: Glyceraldehyde-3-phosphate dehydrogenase [Planctomycetes bacterium ADurb.Bin069]NMD35030.1 type I glyceraldehyde-3-phosphate dehydrogenase [Planctomycetota bacterium]HNR99649.1 type I glyceraldehyde-3-phosphate dehydrogenase [Planctomycetota bacterium]HNU25223.1 type I glyceraldehyde-3-phosphate dehydrogenase [Planctomycetota bacterium]
MTIKIGINGFGRIGKLVFRAAWAAGGFEVVGINDLMDAKSVAHFLHYDSTQGRFAGKVQAAEGAIVVDGKKIPVTAIKDPAQLPWKQQRAEIVVESTGVFASAEDCRKHLAAGAKKVLLTVPPKDKSGEIKIVVMGVNDNALTASDTLVSNASCTTNCLAPMAKVLHETFGIKHGLMTTCHAYTNDQRILDAIHKDLRRARAGAIAIIPTTTGAARAVGKVLPALQGKLDGLSLRVPTPVGSITDLCVVLEKPATVESVNNAMKKAAAGALKGILEYCEDPIVSTDIVGNPASCIFDAPSTMLVEGNLVKVLGWYDNEWGYSCRCIDLMKKMAG